MTRWVTIQFISDVPANICPVKVQKIPFLPRYWTISRKQYAQYTNLWKHTHWKVVSNGFPNLEVFPIRLNPKSCVPLPCAMLLFRNPTWGPGALGTLNRPCFFCDLGDVIWANHPLQPRADVGSGCQSSSPGFFRQYGKEATDLKGRQWDTIHGQSEISNNTPQFVAIVWSPASGFPQIPQFVICTARCRLIWWTA